MHCNTPTVESFSKCGRQRKLLKHKTKIILKSKSVPASVQIQAGSHWLPAFVSILEGGNMRCTQEMGLTAEAVAFLNDNCKRNPLQVCNLGHSHGGELIGEQYSKTWMFDKEIPLFAYELKTEKGFSGKVYEYVQACPWSSGPCKLWSLKEKRNSLLLVMNTRKYSG